MTRRSTPSTSSSSRRRDLLPNIKVVGVGGSGGSAVNRMVKSKLLGVEMVAVNTDAQALVHNQAEIKLHIGKDTTRGLGAGGDPEKGFRSAEESSDELAELLNGSDMVFVTCGLGGGTGTGAAPTVAEIARRQGALTIAVVTKPFAFEGAQRRRIAEEGHSHLAERVDAIITIPNDRILQLIDRQTPLLAAFGIVDEVLKQAVQGISDIITNHGLVNVDFADVKAIMQDAGSALMGIGRASGEGRAVEAARAAIDSPLLELSIEGAKGILFTVTGGPGLAMYEVQEAADIITQNADPEAKIIFGAAIDDTLGDEVRVTVIATGFSSSSVPTVSTRPAPWELNKGSKSAYTPPTVTKKQGMPIIEKVKEVKKSILRERELNNEGLSDSRDSDAKFIKHQINETPNLTEEELEIPAFLRKKMK